MNKIGLIIPPSPFLLDERVFPFLGILRVASAWEKMGAKVEVLDLGGIENYMDVVSDYASSDFDFIGITFTTPQTPNAYSIGKHIKSLYPDVKLVAGGSHPTLMHTAAKRGSQRAQDDVSRLRSVFDVLVCGDGEYTLDEILKTSNGVIDVDDRLSPFFLTDKTFSETPNPARHLIDLSTYHYQINGAKATSLISQLGCPYQCIAGFERVPTENGLLRIDEIVGSWKFEPEDKKIKIGVNCEKGVSKTSHGLNQGIHKSYIVSLKNGLTLTGHPNHRVRVARDGKLIWEKISDLTDKDVAIIQAGSKNYPEKYCELQYTKYQDKA